MRNIVYFTVINYYYTIALRYYIIFINTSHKNYISYFNVSKLHKSKISI